MAGHMASVVFADRVGSTGIFERLGDETAGRFLTQLTTALAKIFEQHNGRVVKLLGDGLFVVFPEENDVDGARAGRSSFLFGEGPHGQKGDAGHRRHEQAKRA